MSENIVKFYYIGGLVWFGPIVIGLCLYCLLSISNILIFLLIELITLLYHIPIVLTFSQFWFFTGQTQTIHSRSQLKEMLGQVVWNLIVNKSC